MMRLEEARRAVLLGAIVSSCILAIGGAFLLPAFLLSYVSEREFARALEIEEEIGRRAAVPETEAAGARTRSSVDDIRAYARMPRVMTAALEQFLDAGDGIAISSLLIRAGGEVAVTGTAATRERLLAFEEALRSSGRLRDIDFPLSNIVRERDIQFTARGVLDPRYAPR